MRKISGGLMNWRRPELFDLRSRPFQAPAEGSKFGNEEREFLLRRERAGVFCMKVIFAIWVLLLIVPARSEQSFSPPDRKGVLPELQKAVGNEWSVTALPDGYLFTYRPLVNFIRPFQRIPS